MPSLSSFLPTVKPGKFFLHDERRDALVSGRRIDRRQQDEDAGFLGVGDPQLLAVQDVLIALQLRASLQRERVGAGVGLAQRIGSHRVSAHPRQVALLLLVGGPAHQRVVHQRVLHIDDHAHRGIDARQLLHRKDGFEECSAAAAVLLRDLDAHQSQFEEVLDQRRLEDALLVHFLNVRSDGFVGKLANGVAKQGFVFGQRDQRSGRHIGCGDI